MGIQINGNTNNINAGIGSLSIEDLNELDIVGVATAANFKTGVSNLHNVGLTLSGGQIDVGSNIKLGNAGVVTATTFSGSGASLTNLPAGNLTGTVADARISTLTASKLTGALPAISGANLTGITQTTINSNVNNYVVTATGTANTLQGESSLTYDGSKLQITGSQNSSLNNNILSFDRAGYSYIDQINDSGSLVFRVTSSYTNALRLDSNAQAIFGSSLYIPDSIIHDGDTDTKIRFPGSNQISFETGGAERFRISNIGHVTVNSTSYQALTITTSENGTNGPEIQLMHNSTSPAVGDTIGQLRYSGKDTAGNTTLYSKIETKVDDPSNGTEGGHLEFSTRGGGAYNSIFRLKARGTASAPNYTADDMNGIILDTYNTGNPYPRYMNFIAKAAGNTDSNIGFWTEAVGGSPTEKMRISADGYVLKPNMPSFFVHGSPSMGTNTGYSNIAYSFAHVKHNTGTHYANNTGRFTAPVAGVYFFCGGLWASMSDQNSGQYLLVFKKNGGEAGVGCNHRTYQNQLSASMVISLSANDIITLGYGDGAGGSVQGSTPRNYFCGYLIG